MMECTFALIAEAFGSSLAGVRMIPAPFSKGFMAYGVEFRFYV